MEQVSKDYKTMNRVPYMERLKVQCIEEQRKEKGIKPFTKVVVSGSVIEVYQYDKPPLLRKGQIETEDEEKEDRTLERRKQTAREARNMVRRLVLSNFDNGSKFITLTFAEDIQDVREANKVFKKFIQRMRYKYGQFKYVAVIEFTKAGRVHYHMMSDLPFILNSELAAIWRNGFVRINEIEHVDNVGAYMVKYMVKDLEDMRLAGNKCYQTSKGLDRPKEYKGAEAELILQVYELEQKKEVFCSSYPTEYQDHCTYKEFNLKRL